VSGNDCPTQEIVKDVKLALMGWTALTSVLKLSVSGESLMQHPLTQLTEAVSSQ